MMDGQPSSLQMSTMEPMVAAATPAPVPQAARQRPASSSSSSRKAAAAADPTTAAAADAAPSAAAASSSSSSATTTARPIRPSTAPMGTPAAAAEATSAPAAAATAASATAAAAPALLPRCRQARAVPPEAIIHNLPSLLLTPPGLARKALFAKKVRLCCHMLDMGPGWSARHAALSPKDAEAADRARETKRLTLLELVNFHTLARPLWGAEELTAVFDMLAWNILRPLPPNSFELHCWGGREGGGAGAGVGGFTFMPEEDPQIEDGCWPHVQIVYELLLRMVSFIPSAQAQQTMANAAAAAAASPTPNKENPYPEPVPTLQQLQTAHKLLYSPAYLSRRFILGLLYNFRSEDSRERDYLKTITHRIYGQSMSLRPFIRRNIQHILCEVMYTNERQHGLSELLEILGSIINGFAIPLKSQHVDVLLTKVLLPLHKLTHLALFHPQLSYCIVQFLEKDPTLAQRVLVALLALWPRRNSKKEVLFLHELDEVIERVPTQTKPPPSTVAPPAGPTTNLCLPVLSALLTQLGSCLYNLHFQVSEKAIYMLGSEPMLRKLVFFAGAGAPPGADHREQLVPIIARAVYINTEIPLCNSLDPAATPIRRSSNAAAATTAAAVKALRINSAAAASSDPTHPGSPRSGGGGDPDSSAAAALFGATSPAASSAVGSTLPTKGHWNATITELSSDISKVMLTLDAKLCNAASKQLQAEFAAARGAPPRSRMARQAKPTSVNLAEAQAAVARANAAAAAAAPASK